jgi:hypothetical protein
VARREHDKILTPLQPANGALIAGCLLPCLLTKSCATCDLGRDWAGSASRIEQAWKRAIAGIFMGRIFQCCAI